MVESRVSELDDYFKSHDLSSPSLAAEAGPGWPLPAPLAKSRDEALDASTELQALLAGPLAHLTRLTSPTASVTMKVY